MVFRTMRPGEAEDINEIFDIKVEVEGMMPYKVVLEQRAYDL
jgi:hypothetical protein